VNAALLADESVRTRLFQDCSAHARVVRDVIDAHLSGHLEDAVAMRTCALELHSVKGAASVLGLHAITTVIGGLCEPMLERARPEAISFWTDFHQFFANLICCMVATAENRVDPSMLDTAIALRERVMEGLGVTSFTRAPTPVIAPGRALSPSAGRRLLLIDDSATVRAALSARLVDRGYPVRTARSLMETARMLGSSIRRSW
jgi:hypothetical protein